ncbi:MAG: hypothetical protein NVS2B2_26300 [Ktedonobacteraceae bacterium]
MSSVSQVQTVMRQVLEEDANRLARETGFLQRQRVLTGALFVQVLVFGWMQHVHSTLAQLVQLVPLHQVKLSAPGLSKRFNQKAAEFLYALLQRVAQVRIQAEAVEVPCCAAFRRWWSKTVHKSCCQRPSPGCGKGVEGVAQ